MKWLVEHKIEADRLSAKGYGPDKPIADNKKEVGRAKNRRVDFIITDPAAPAGVVTVDSKTVEAPKSPDQSDGTSKKGKKGKKGKK